MKNMLRPYQKIAVERILWSLKLDGNSLCVIPTGGGKTWVIATLAKEMNQPILILVPSREILRQDYEKLALLVPKKDIGIYSAGLKQKKIKKYTLATIQSAYRKSGSFMHFGLVIIDECFVAGTKVDGRNIEDIKPGDYVTTYNHKMNTLQKEKVKAVSKRKITSNLQLTDLTDSSIISTRNHPVFVIGKGYVQAKDLQIGDNVYAIPKKSNKRDSMFRMWKNGISKRLPSLLEIQKNWENLSQGMFSYRSWGHYFKIKEGSTYSLFATISQENVRETQENRTQTPSSGREWEGSNRDGIEVAKNLGGGVENWRNSENLQEIQRRLPTSLQIGYSERKSKNSNRSGWWFSQFFGKKKTRQEKRETLTISRVENISVYKSRDRQTDGKNSNASNYVYNLQLEGENNNYFANGVLVHNCDLVNPRNLEGMFTKFLKVIGSPKIIGFTATPFRICKLGRYKGTGIKLINRMREYFWQRIIFNISTQELTDQGYLAPLLYYPMKLIESRDIPINKSRTDYDMKLFEEKIGSKQEQIRNIISYARRNATKTIVFCSSIEQAEKLASETKGGAAVSAKTPAKERDRLIADFKAGKIPIIFNCMLLGIGYDDPMLDCIVLLRPTKSIRLLNQFLGRGTRIAPNKQECLVIDATDSVRTIGRLHTIRVAKVNMKWELLSETSSYWHNKQLYADSYEKPQTFQQKFHRTFNFGMPSLKQQKIPLSTRSNFTTE